MTSHRLKTLLAGSFAVVLVATLGVVIASQATHAEASEAEHKHDVLYQCPMHPQIVSDGEGRCPLCNMFLKERPAKEALAKRKAWEDKTGEKAPPMIMAAKPSGAGASEDAAAPSAQDNKATPKAADDTAATSKAAPKTSPANTTPTPGPDQTEAQGAFTCPMHPYVNGEEGGRCPVCGMNLIPRAELEQHQGHAHDHDTYTCPMHPTVVTDEAGRCPICGMDLVKKDIAPPPAKSAAELSERKIKHWVAPMDPTYISDKPGKSPMGMDLVPVYEDDGKTGSLITIDPVVMQNMGVRIARVERMPLFRHIRALGTVDVAESEIAVVNLRFSGWIEKLYVDETGEKVRRGQALAEVYSPELVSAQEELLLALRTAGATSPLATSARRRLAFFGMGDADMKRLEDSRQTLRTIRIRAPREGYVLHKAVVQGARVMAGTDLFRIGSLQNIWINAEVYEYDAAWVELDAPATMELTFEQGRLFSGKVGYIYPTLNPKSRTLTVRLEFENPGLSLKPGMFATVRIEARRKEGALAIPTEAIIHSGERQIVFVALGGGRYDKRELTTGLVADRHLTEVTYGLQEGERVVVSGQFLLDSESQLQEAVQKLLAARLEVNNPGAAAESATSGSDEQADTYWTCSMHPQIVQDGPGTCPICGMGLVEKRKQ